MINLSTSTPIIEVKGVGKSQSLKFSKLGIESIGNLLFHIPFRYRDTSEILNISDFKLLNEGTFLAQIVEVKNIYTLLQLFVLRKYLH